MQVQTGNTKIATTQHKQESKWLNLINHFFKSAQSSCAAENTNGVFMLYSTKQFPAIRQADKCLISGVTC